MGSKEIEGDAWLSYLGNEGLENEKRQNNPILKRSSVHTMKLPSKDVDVFGTFPATDDLVLASCRYCDKRINSQFLKEHIERAHPTRSNNSDSSLQHFDLFVQSEIETSSSNSSPIWLSDKNQYEYSHSLSSSSSNSVNIVRLKQDKPKPEHKNNTPIEFLLCGQVPAHVKQEPEHMKLESMYGKPQPPDEKQDCPYMKHDPIYNQQESTLLPSQSTTTLPRATHATVMETSCTKPEGQFECHSIFETVQPSTSFVTSVEDSSSETDKKTPKLIIRRVPHQNPKDLRRFTIEKVPHQNPKDLRRFSLEKGVKEDSLNSEKLQYFLVTKGHGRPQNLKTSRHQVKKKFSESREENINQSEEQAKYLRASEQQIAALTRRIETLNRQIETLTGQVEPLRLENEEYKSEIRNLRGRVDELESNTNSLIEQRELREKNDTIIQELQQKWERERYHFIQRLEELQTELSDYKNNSTVEKQKLSYINIILEKKYGLQVALTENLQDEKKILERHLPPGVHFHLNRSELVEIQRQRALICALLNVSETCPVGDPSSAAFPSASVEQLPLTNSQVVDMNAYLPVDSHSTEIASGNNGQLINVFNLSENKIQYRNYPHEVSSDKAQIFDLPKEEKSNDEDKEEDIS